MKEKFFIITVDTEGDNLWGCKPIKKELLIPSTENARYIERFQMLCENYRFLPTYLVDYEMAKSKVFTQLGKSILQNKTGEIGMHMHAFSTPPFYELSDLRGRNLAFMGEYPQQVICAKMEYMTKLLQDTFQVSIKSHRGGRWCLDNRILKSMEKLGYIVDCTVTPGVSWSNTKGQTGGSKGADYSQYRNKVYRIKNSRVLELPVTIRQRGNIDFHIGKGVTYYNRKIWMRPNGHNIDDMKWLVDRAALSECNYIEFMIHSSELMEGANPSFRTKRDIENLYSHMEEIFDYLNDKGYKGITCTDYIVKYNEKT